MFMTEINYPSMESSPHDEVSYSDVENVALSPDDHRIDVINVEQSIDDRSFDKGIRSDDGRSWTMAKVQVGYDVTRKGERSLVVDGFKFTKSRDGTNNRIFWRCSRRECKATAVTVCDRVEHVRAIHAHEPPLAAEFFGSHEGVTQHCELQEVRFNTNAANMRPRYRRMNASLSESNPEESLVVKDISNSTSNACSNISPMCQNSYSTKSDGISPPIKMHKIEIKPAPYIVPNINHKTPNSVKDQVRDFILRNSSQITNCPQNNGISVAQLLISPVAQSPFLHTNNNAVSSSSCNSNTVFNFNPVQIGALSTNGSDSTSDISSLKSAVESITVQPLLREDSQCVNKSIDTTGFNQMQIEDIIHMLLNSSANRKRSSSDSEWSSPTPGPGLAQVDRPINSGSTLLSAGLPDGYQVLTPSRFVHWKKERLMESEMGHHVPTDRLRRYDDYNYDGQSDQFVNTTSTQSPEAEPIQLSSILTSFRPTITKKLMGVMYKLTSELCPEDAVAQEVFEKCTAIKTCLETLEKVHSLASV